MDQIDDRITIEQLAAGNEQKRIALKLSVEYRRRFGVPPPLMYLPQDYIEYAKALNAALRSGRPIDVKTIGEKIQDANGAI